MKHFASTMAVALLMATAAVAQQGAFLPWKQPSGAFVSGQVLLCDTGVDRIAVPCGGPAMPMGVLAAPFIRSGSGDPIIFDGVTTTAKQFAVTKPAVATSYRFVNPCNVDVRIRKVASMTETVTLTTGTPFMARSSETLGTSEPKFVSIIATAAPSGDCSTELQYGRGG